MGDSRRQCVRLKLPHPGIQRRQAGRNGNGKVIVLSVKTLGILDGPIEDGSRTQLVVFLVRHILLSYFSHCASRLWTQSFLSWKLIASESPTRFQLKKMFRGQPSLRRLDAGGPKSVRQKVTHKTLFSVPTFFMNVREFYPSLRIVGLNLRAMSR